MHVLTLCSSLSGRDDLGCSSRSRPRCLPSIILGVKGPPNGSEKLRIICRMCSLCARNGSLWQRKRKWGQNESQSQVSTPHPLFIYLYIYAGFEPITHKFLSDTNTLKLEGHPVSCLRSQVKCSHTVQSCKILSDCSTQCQCR